MRRIVISYTVIVELEFVFVRRIVISYTVIVELELFL